MEVVVPLGIYGYLTLTRSTPFYEKTANRKKTKTQGRLTPPRASRKTNRPEPQTAKSKSPFQEEYRWRVVFSST